MLNSLRIIALPLALLASAQAHALEAEVLDVVAIQLTEAWTTSCITVPLGSHVYSGQSTGASITAEQGAMSYERAVDLGAWGETDAVTVTFSDHLGNPTTEPSPEGGTVLVELLAAGDPLIEITPDNQSACLLQGRFTDIHPTSIVPVTLDDGRPGRIYFFSYAADWSAAITQRYGMSAERIAAALVSFDPGIGWDRIESFRTEDFGLSFAPDSFSSDGLARFDAGHKDRIEIVEVPEHYLAGLALTVRHGADLPEDVAACREEEPWDQPDCLDAVAQSGAILGALSICARDDTGCLTDLLHASAPDAIADWCLPQLGDDGSSLPRCQAFAALTGTQDQTAVALPHWRSPRLIRRDEAGGGVAFFIRAHSLEYGPIEEFETSERQRLVGTPYLKIACEAGRLGAAMLYAAHSPLWAPGEEVSASVKGQWDEENDTEFALLADSDETTLAFDDGDIERFFRNALRGESFDLTTSGATAMRAHFSIRRIVSAFGGDIDLPTLLSDTGCGKAVERVFQ